MKVAIRLYGHAKRLLGGSQLEVSLPEGSTLADLIKHIEREHGRETSQFFRPDSNNRFPMIILIGGKDHRSIGGMEASLSDEAVVDFIPPAVGGARPTALHLEEARLG